MTLSPGTLDENLHPVAEVVFGDRLGTAEAYARELATSGVVRGLIGPREVDRIWERHVLNCAVVAELVPAGASVVDVGSGAGLPGIPMALARPDLRLILVEPLLRRTQWLGEVVTALALDNVVIERARAEDSSHRGEATVVTGRAVTQLPKFVPLAVPLLQQTGLILAMKGQSAATELAAASAVLAEQGVEKADILECGTGLLEIPTTVVRLSVERSLGRSPSPASARRRTTKR